MISTELATRILLTVFIVGAYSINYCRASDDENHHSLKPNQNIGDDEQVTSSVESESSLSSRSFQASNEAKNDAGTRLMPDSAESGILLPYEEYPHPGGDGARRLKDRYLTNQNDDQKKKTFPESVSFQTKPIPLRISNAKALNWDSGKLSGEDEKPTYYIRNNCFGPRCTKNSNNQHNAEDWKTVYYTNKESKSKKFDDDIMMGPTRRLEDNVMESMSSNFHSQLAIPFVVVDDNINSLSRPQTFSRRSGVDRFTRMTSTTNPPPGWVKLRPISPDAYDPFHYSMNSSRDSERKQNTFSKRDSSNANTVNFSKRVGVELNPESFADRWGWSGEGGNDNNNRGGGGGGSRLPAWLEDQLKYGTRNSDNKNWVKLDPIPVAGVSISKWVPKGTPSQDLPTTSWQTNRDRPNGGNPWWDRIDQNRILTGNNGNRHAFLRPGVEDSYNPPPSNNNMGWGDSNKGSSLASLDRYPTNSWNDVIYPEGPVSATVSWQQNKGTSNNNNNNYPSPSFSSGDRNSGWPSSGSDTRKPIVATGSWSAPPQNNRLPSFLNRFSDRRPSSYPTKQINEEDPRWVLISNTRRVATAKGNENDRTKVLSYINRLHPDLDRSSDFPFYEPSSTAHRHGKGYWPFQQGSATVPVSPAQDEAFHRINATLSTLTPVLIHRGSGGTTVRPPIVGTIRPNKSGVFFSTSTGSPLPSHLSAYLGDGRATSSNADLQQLSSTTNPVRSSIPGRLRQGLKNINPIYAAVGAGMIPATLAAVMPMVLGRKRRDVSKYFNHFPIYMPRNHNYTSNNPSVSINPIKFRKQIARVTKRSNR